MRSSRRSPKSWPEHKRGQEQAAYFLNEVHFRVRYLPGSGWFFVRPEAVVDFESQLWAAVSGYPADSARLQFIQMRGDHGWRSGQRSRQLINRSLERAV